jgi:Beta/Gamma crystallin
MGRRLVVLSAALFGCVLCLQGCSSPPNLYAGPGCRIDLYTLPNLQGYGLPVVKSTPELSEAWRNTASSARVIYGTWRLFTDPDYEGFMGDYSAPAVVAQLRPARELESLRCIKPEPWPPSYYVSP